MTSYEKVSGSPVTVRCATLIDLLEGRAARTPNKVLYTFLPDGEENGISVTYGELSARARAVANRLASRAAVGDRALMLFPSGLEFLYGFFGCLYAGLIAVPAYPPRRNQNLVRLKAIIEDCDPALVLTTSKVMTVAEPLFAETPDLKALSWLTVDQEESVLSDGWEMPAIDGDSLAFLQYTSGSTGNPKGVMVSHGNLLANEAMVHKGFGSQSSDVVVSWLPMFHDMGLIGNTLQPLYSGASTVFMSPASFLQKPLRWLKAVSDFKGTGISGPNFGYELCVRQITDEQKAGLDLSSLRIAMSGAEPVRADTLDAFCEAFGPCGFRRDAFAPGYGLAEGTLLLSSPQDFPRPVYADVDPGALAENRIVPVDAATGARFMRLVSNGKSFLDDVLVIVDPVSRKVLPEGQVGEIWSAGRHVAKGYWRNETATEETFQAFTDDGRGPFLRTGDLGCQINGELYITGRLKDVLIIRGRNHYPQDIEYTIQQSHVALKADAGAAFVVEIDGEERLVIAQEVERSYRNRLVADVVAAAIREAVAENHELQVYAIAFLKPGAILKTSSGKIQRSANRKAFLDDSLEIIAIQSLQRTQSESDNTAIEQALALTREAWLQLPDTRQQSSLVLYLKAAIASTIGVALDHVRDDVSLMGLGIDSLQITQLFTRLRDRFQIDLELSALFEADNFNALSDVLSQAMTAQNRATLPALQPMPRSEWMPLSFSQKRMWFLDRLVDNKVVYNLPFAMKIQGALNIDALEKAFGSMVNRHEILRTIYVEQNGRVFQQVLPPSPWQFAIEDLRELSDSALAQALAERIEQEARTPFDLARGPVMRTRLLYLPPQESQSENNRAAEQYLLLITMHHIAADGFSLKVITDEITRAYDAELHETTSTLPALPIQYADFALWQKSIFDQGLLNHQLAYWVDQLQGVEELDLPTDHARPPEQSFKGGNVYFDIDSEQVAALKKLSREQGVTLYMTLLASFKVLLHHYTYSDDICVGTPIANRATPELESLIGFFVNTLALRTDLGGNPSFVDFLQRVRSVTLGAFAHQEMPFERVVEALNIPRDLSYSPLFQVMFVLQNSTIDEAFHLAGANVERLHTTPGTAKFDMTLEFSEESGVLRGSLEFATDLFEQATVERWAAHYCQLIASILAAPQTPIGLLNLVTAEERSLLLNDFNDTDRPYSEADTLHSLFEAQVEKTPLATAVVYNHQRISYGELNERANRLAHHLISLGVKDEMRVAVCLDRTPDLLVAVFAIHKAGGAYVPVDPQYPRDRVAYMLGDGNTSIVISQSNLNGLLQTDNTQHHVHIVNLDQVDLSAEATSNPAVVMTSQQLAYVIYTSGSTGKPKGVMITHSNAAWLVHWGLSVFSPQDLSGTLFATSICFDLSIFEIFVTLSGGGKIILADNLLALSSLPAKNEVVLINTVPSALAVLHKTQGIPDNVKIVITAGEFLPSHLSDSIYETTAIERIYDLYGPSEVTTYCTGSIRQQRLPCSIGRPFQNTRAYLLNKYGQLVPPGHAGEVYISGLCVTRGYLNQPGLTQEKYLSNPFASSGIHARMYRTGDMARYRADGEMEFICRIDHQVKVRGFRIELGEIQSVINQLSMIEDSLVITQEDASGTKFLVAYLVSLQVPFDVISQARKIIHEQLPDYMMPSAFVVVPAFPLTPNGKLDRSALPEPQWDVLLADTFVAPASETEHKMAKIWCEVLELGRVGVTHNFFELGGHSLRATQCIARIRDEFNVDLPVKTLFTMPTIRQLCELVEESVAELSAFAPPPVERVSRQGELPMSFAQMRIWLLDQLESGHGEYGVATAYSMPAALRVKGALDTDALRKAFRALVDRHESLRTSFVVEDGYATQVIRDSEYWFMDVRDLRHLDSEEREVEVKRLAEEEAARAFDLQYGGQYKARRIRLLRTRLLQTSDDEHVLLLNMHHIISDGWSIKVLMDDLGALYGARLQGAPSALEPLYIQYVDYAAWQRTWMEGPVFEHQLNYWKQTLAAVPVLELPTDRPRPAVMTFNGSYESVQLDQTLTHQLNALARNQGATLYMTLLTAFYGLLYRYSGQSDLCIGTPVANRVRPEFEGLIGCFVNTLALRVDLDGNPTFVDLLQRVQDVTLGAFAHQDLPFERLVEALGVARDRSHAPLFQVMFTLQNASSTRTLSLPGLTLELLPSVARSAKFDITLNLEEGPDGLAGMFEYNTDLFDRSTMQRMTQHFQRVLAAVVDHPHLRLSELSLLSDGEKRLLLQDWNHSPASYHFEGSIHDRFEAQAACTPTRIAVTQGEVSLTYRQLNEQANQLARVIKNKGVEAGQRVAIGLGRTPDMVVAILAVLKAGAAYVPVDPNNPQERNRFILEDSGVALLLTESSVAEKLPAAICETLLIDRIQSELVQQTCDNLDLPVNGDDHAYVIYTSGTTGTPKGVLIPHANVIRLFSATEHWYHFDHQDVWTVFHSFAFDFSVWELWGALFYGGRAVVVPTSIAQSSDEFYTLVCNEGVTVLNQTPSAFTQFIRVDQQCHKVKPALAQRLSLRYVIFGGEALDFAALQTWREHHGLDSPQLINMYGITETTVHVTYHRIVASDLDRRQSLIGRPIPDLDLYILDDHKNPVPIGVPGELYVGGQGLAHGYLNRQELTDERFVPASSIAALAARKGLNRNAGLYDRLYKTGDVCRYLSNGVVEYLGRIDDQVKIRGFRIELGEIESTLSQFPGVRDAVVLARPDAFGDKRLVAYVVAEETTLDIAALRDHVRISLPGYMVPSACVLMETFPLTINGKIDKRQLPEPDDTAMVSSGYVAPRNETEAALVQIWQDVLKRERIGIRDNFFDIGGHSLLATQVTSRVRQHFNLELAQSALFEDPTIERFALHVLQEELSGTDVDEMAELLAEIEGLSEDALSELFE